MTDEPAVEGFHGGVRAVDPHATEEIGWIPMAVHENLLDKAAAYRRQLLANGIKPDLETFRFPPDPLVEP